MKLARYFLAVALLANLTGLAYARGLGSPAMPLQIEEWIKGDAIQLADGKDKNVFVLVFWSSTDPHSRASLPFVSEMQRQFKDKDVIFIGITMDDVETVKSYVAEQSDKMDFRIAADSAKTTTRLYFQSVHNREMPHAFIIDKKGVMVWNGHPMGSLDKFITSVLDGTYDIETGRRLQQARGLAALYLQLAASPGKASQCDDVGKRVLEYGISDILLMNDFAYRIAAEPGLLKRDLDLALKAAQSAYEGSKGQNPDILDTYACVLFKLGQKQEAIERQREAVKLARDEESRQGFQKTLEKYEQAEEPD